MPAEHVYVPDMTPLMTAEDLRKPGVPERADLVRGVLVVHEPPGFRHGEITVRLTIGLGTYVDNRAVGGPPGHPARSEEHTSELQSLRHLVCRLPLENKKDYT